MRLCYGTRGVVYFSRLDKNNEAIECYKKSLKIAPDFNDALKNMVILFNLLDDYIEKLNKNNDEKKLDNYTNLTYLAQSLLINGEIILI